MRILLVANTLPPADLSGVGEQVLQLAEGLRHRGHEVEVLGRGPGGARGGKVLFPLTVVPAVARALRRFRPEVVQVHESDGALAALLVAVVGACQAPRPRLVALLQVSYLEEMRAVRPLRYGDLVLGRPGRVERRFRWSKAPVQIVLGCLTAWLAETVLAPSRRTAEELERDYLVSAVRVLPNATGGLPAPGAEGEPPTGDAALLFVGRLRLRKGLEVLLHALTELRASGLRPSLWIAGEGEHRESLERLAASLELGGQVRFLGRQSAGQVRALLEACRALVIPSIYEGMPLVALEAMSCSRPVVASAVSGIPEVVVDGVTGWLVPPEDPPRLAVALRATLADTAEAERRGRAGKERVLRAYSPDEAARTWESLLAGATPGEG